MTQDLKVGVIGAGYWGKKQVDEYSRLGASVLVADLSQDNLSFCAEKSGARTTKDYHDILSDDSIRHVSVCTPNDSHYALAKECLSAGKNVLVEKPLSSTVEEGKDLIRTATKNDVALVVGHIFRFNNAVNRLRDMVVRREFGVLYLAKFKWTNLEKVFTDRDVIYDLAPHPFDLLDYLFGRAPDEVSCVGNCFRQDKVMEAAFINLRIEHMIANIELSWILPKKERSLALVGSRKTAFADLAAQKVTIFDNATNAFSELNIVPNNTIQDELLGFIRSSSDRTQSIADAEVGLKAIRLIELAEQSHKEKKTLSLKFV